MIPGRDIATASEWKRRGYRIRDSEAPILKVKIWKPTTEHGMILVDAHFYDITQIEKFQLQRDKVNSSFIANFT